MRGHLTNELAQAEALELARRGAGQLGEQEDPARALVRRQFGLGNASEIAGEMGRRGGVLRDDEGERLDQAVLVGGADDAGVGPTSRLP
ncbi:MAG: hypothetical protein AUH18_02805 [Candidatus Rokubacteria bacterium 13_2_20CM_69_10]|nr:MAG: hypothetical protein AUH18_02805 [Candidatus Rokubacteria bacterium 13_2_20CM_69_10]